MIEFIGEIIATFFELYFLRIFKYFGAALRWPFLFKKFTFRELLTHPWNIPIGMTVFALLFWFFVFELDYSRSVLIKR